jgi:hypothetical protein
MSRDRVFRQLEASLDRVHLRDGRVLLVSWGEACPLIADAGLRGPSDVPGWVWTLAPEVADEVLRALVGLAQRGDELAGLVVLVCLRPGVRALAGQGGLAVDELVSELAVVVLEFPLGRRRSVAGQLLLDARKRLLKRETSRDIPEGDTRSRLEDLEAPGELGAGDRAPERLAELVRDAWLAGDVSTEAARLVLMTRVWGEPVAAAARRLGVNPKAVRARRSRAEARIAKALRS